MTTKTKDRLKEIDCEILTVSKRIQKEWRITSTGLMVRLTNRLQLLIIEYNELKKTI